MKLNMISPAEVRHNREIPALERVCADVMRRLSDPELSARCKRSHGYELPPMHGVTFTPWMFVHFARTIRRHGWEYTTVFTESQDLGDGIEYVTIIELYSISERARESSLYLDGIRSASYRLNEIRVGDYSSVEQETIYGMDGQLGAREWVEMEFNDGELVPVAKTSS